MFEKCCVTEIAAEASNPSKKRKKPEPRDSASTSDEDIYRNQPLPRPAKRQKGLSGAAVKKYVLVYL